MATKHQKPLKITVRGPVPANLAERLAQLQAEALKGQK